MIEPTAATAAPMLTGQRVRHPQAGQGLQAGAHDIEGMYLRRVDGASGTSCVRSCEAGVPCPETIPHRQPGWSR
jgi:hypothetical protein